MTLLKLEAVSSAYGQSKVLWDIDMRIERGGAVALIGRNGVGKSTLLNTIAGVQKLTGGKITFDGADVSSAPAHGRARAGIGYVPQGRHVFPQLSVMENLTVGLAALSGRKGLSESGIAAHIFELFPKLTQIKNRKAGLLSGGEQQQLAIGRALAGQPKLLLLDEPLSALDADARDLVLTRLQGWLMEKQIQTILVTHDAADALATAAEVAVLQEGRLAALGPARIVLATERQRLLERLRSN